ncbi:MAG TPA: glycosyltransferase [Acidiferrobacteraceae bacterium]|nr:glycosyltransferase [Acidiferrobacteraceae bacterium]
MQPDLLLFAKQPVAGQVKTRLQPKCNPQQAACIAGYLVRATCELAVKYWPGSVYLYTWPNSDHPLFGELADQFPITLAVQSDGDLGAKMIAALEEGIGRSGGAAVMGCDVPHCPGGILVRASEHLCAGEEILGPCNDGGYYLIGLNKSSAHLFADMDWGGDKIASKTLFRAKQDGRHLNLLPQLRDIDTWEDLNTVAEHHTPLRQFMTNEIDTPIHPKIILRE